MQLLSLENKYGWSATYMKQITLGQGAKKNRMIETRLKWEMCKFRVDLRKEWWDHPEHSWFAKGPGNMAAWQPGRRAAAY